MNKKFIQRVALVFVLAISLLGIFGVKDGSALAVVNPATQFASSSDPWGAIDDKARSCTKSSSAYSWFSCSFNKAISRLSTSAYEVIVDLFLETDPALFENSSLQAGWETARRLANLVILLLLIITIGSEITGIGISNYGVKKALPRLVVLVVVVNLSLIACRIAVDLMNISAEAIRATFEPLTDVARTKINYDPGVATVFGSILGAGIKTMLTIVTTFLGTKTFLASGESIRMLALGVGITIAVGIVLLFAVVAVRSALVVLLTISSPIAVLLYIFPGTKRTFDMWFSLFRGVLVCYPVTAMMVYGGNFASAVAMAALGVNGITIGPITLEVNVFTLLVAAAASVVPLIMLPGMIIRSTGAIGAAMQGVANRLNGLIQGRVNNTAFAQRWRREAMDRSNRLKAGVDENGQQRSGRLASLMRSNSPEERAAAQQALADSRARGRAEVALREKMDAEDTGDTEASDEAEKQMREDLGTSFKDDNPETVKKVLDKIFGTEEDPDLSADPDVIAGKVEGALHFFRDCNPKTKAESELLRRLDGLAKNGTDEQKAQAAKIRQAVAKYRMQSGGDKMKAKTPVEYQYYKAASTDGSRTFGDGSDYVEALVDSPDFTPDAMSNYATQDIKAIAKYFSTHRGDDSKKSYTESIASTFDLMRKSSAFRKNAAPEDFEVLKSAIFGA